MTMERCLHDIQTEYDSLEPNALSKTYADALDAFDELWRELPEDEQSDAMRRLADIVQKEKYLAAVYTYSMLSFRSHEPEWMEGLLDAIGELPEPDMENLFSLYWQLSQRFMLWQECKSEKGITALWKLYQRLCEQCRAQVTGLDRIPQAERDPDTVIVLVAQYLEPKGHGPSKTALDRCKMLMERMQKKVLLINTAEIGAWRTTLPWFGSSKMEYSPEYSAVEYIDWQGCRIPFFQCDNDMPNVAVYQMLVQTIRQMKPQLVLEIGTGSVLAHLLSQCVPVLSVVTGFSRLAISETTCQVSALRMTEQDRRILHAVGKSEDAVLPSVFTFGLDEQKTHLTRAQLGLPEDRFLLAVVGMRLHFEIDAAFMDMLATLDERFAVVFVGAFDHYEQFMQDYRYMKDDLFYIGVQDDVLAVLEVCDLFVNPIRVGGGTSAAEALSKQLPVVSTDYGDIAATVGADFLVRDYADMSKTIRRYCEDTEFYKAQQKKAAARAERLLDTAGEFERVLHEFGKRIGEGF